MSEQARPHPIPATHAETARTRKQDTSHPSALTEADVDALLTTVQTHATSVRDPLEAYADRTERVDTGGSAATAYCGPDILDIVFDSMALGGCVRRSMVRVAHTEAAVASGLEVPGEVVLVAEDD